MFFLLAEVDTTMLKNESKNVRSTAVRHFIPKSSYMAKETGDFGLVISKISSRSPFGRFKMETVW
jgi:hypothetical protein